MAERISGNQEVSGIWKSVRIYEDEDTLRRKGENDWIAIKKKDRNYMSTALKK